MRYSASYGLWLRIAFSAPCTTYGWSSGWTRSPHFSTGSMPGQSMPRAVVKVVSTVSYPLSSSHSQAPPFASLRVSPAPVDRQR